MLIEPAEKVAEPLIVVMRTRSNAPESAGLLPAVARIHPEKSDVPKAPLHTQVFALSKVN